MPETIKVAVVDDHPLVREGIVHAISSSDDMQVVGQGGTAGEAVDLVRLIGLDILLLDLSIPGLGISALEAVNSLPVHAKVIVLTVSEDSGDVLEALRNGACGYVLKGISCTDLRDVVRRVHRAERYVSPELGARLLSDLSRNTFRSSSSLSRRETDIVQLIRRGCCNKDIANRLRISEKTVKHYLTTIFRKLEVRNRTELALLDPRSVVH